MASPTNSIGDAGRQASSTHATAFDHPSVTGDAHQWLAALRLDRAAAALGESS
jgi:hypothetical protein